MTTRLTDTERFENWLIDLENRVRALELSQEPSLASYNYREPEPEPPMLRMFFPEKERREESTTVEQPAPVPARTRPKFKGGLKL